MMEQDPLSQLRDIHLPDPGGFWPPAPGWWALLILALVLLALVSWWLIRRHRRNRWLVQALSEIDQLAVATDRDTDWFRRLNQLLKRCARHRYPQRFPESLSGNAWVDFLLETGTGGDSASRTTLEDMVASSWNPEPSCDADQAIAVARLWLRGQKC